MLPSTRPVSHPKRRTSPWRTACALATLLALKGKVTLAVTLTTVSTPAALQQAAAAGAEHIVITEHLDLRGLAMQAIPKWKDDTAAVVLVNTLTVTGRCMEKPTQSLAVPWKEGQCVLVFDGVFEGDGVDHLALVAYASGKAAALWLNNIYVLMPEPAQAVPKRWAMWLHRDSPKHKTYLTDVTFESTAGGTVSEDGAMHSDSALAASGLNVFNYGPTEVEPVYFKRNAALIDSQVTGNDASGVPAWTIGGAIRCLESVALQQCTLSDNMGVGDAEGYDLRASKSTEVYSDTSLAFYDADAQTARPSLPLGDAPAGAFLTFGDDEFVTIQTQVEEALSASDPASPGDPVSPGGEPQTSLPGTPVSPEVPGTPAGPTGLGPPADPGSQPAAPGSDPTGSPGVGSDAPGSPGVGSDAPGAPGGSDPPGSPEAPGADPQGSPGVTPEGPPGTESAPSGSPSGSSSSNPAMIVGVVLGVLAAVACALVALFLWRRHRRKRAIAASKPDDLSLPHSSPIASAPLAGAKNSAPVDDERAEMSVWTADDSVTTSLASSIRHNAYYPPNATVTAGTTSQLVTMTACTDDGPDATIWVATTPLASPAAATKTTPMTTTTTTTTVVGPPLRQPSAVDARHLPPNVEALVDALDMMHEENCLLMGRWRVKDATRRRVGGQGVVQGVKDTKCGRDSVVAKFFIEQKAFEREAELYATERIRDMMAAVIDVQDNSDGAITAPDGTPFPPFIVLEKGSSLNEWAQITKPDFVTSLQVLVQIVERLGALHACATVHRDIKPANILWRTKRNNWTLIDFGCATADGAEAPLACSIPYAPPEVLQAIKDGRTRIQVDTSMDIWALGVVMYELFTGERAFGPGSSVEDIINALTVSSEPLPWETGSDRAHLMRRLGMVKSVVKLALSRDPRKRPSARRLLKSLNELFYTATTVAHTQSTTAST